MSAERRDRAMARTPNSDTRRVSATFLIESLQKPGGSERQCIELARQLVRDGHHIEIFTLDGDLSAHAAQPSDPQIPLRAIGRSRVGRALGAVHPKLGQAWEMLRLGMAVARAPGPSVLVPHHYPAHWAAALAGWLMRRPVVWLCNDWMYQPITSLDRLERAARRLRRRPMLALDGLLVRRFARVLVLSHLAQRLVDPGYRVRSSVFRTGATGVDEPAPSRLEGRRSLGLPPGAFVVSCVCILMPHRRVEDLIRAISALRREASADIRLVHAGGAASPQLLATLKALALTEGVSDQVRFLGSVSEKTRQAQLAASDAFVFPVDGQTWGLAPLEAMAAGVPTLVSASSGVAEVIRHGRDGFVYQAGDVKELTRLLRALLEDPQFRAELAAGGRLRWQRRFTWPRAAKRFQRQLDAAQGKVG